MNHKDIQALANNFQHISQVIDCIPVMKKMPVVEVGEILQGLDIDYLIELLRYFSETQQGLIVAEFPVLRQIELFQNTSRKHFAPIFENMPSEHRADLFQHLTQKEQAGLLPYLTKKIRDNVIQLSAYPPENAGGIMSTDFAAIPHNITCQEAIEMVREQAPSKRTVYYIYVIDEDKILQGFVTLKDLILASPSLLIQEIMFSNFVFAEVNEDRESVANKIERYDLLAIPVVNSKNQLLGIVTHDDAIEVIRAEHTEDMERFMGIVSDNQETNYADTTSWQHFKKRVVWIVSLAAFGIISGLIIHSYENALETLLILALYMPMVADTGGNSGSQAATVVVRALALGQIKLNDWLSIIWKEAKVAVLLSICLGLLAYGKILFLSWETDLPDQYSLQSIAAVISFALMLQVITATVIGAGLPMLVKRFGGDPAVAASPAITTVVDITGLLIYFGVATIFFTL
ncbi:MAG: magnesium transporter [Flavobacteriales bacterium]|nr:MAG: magnesium transporter [Flavobacteriales bacterium]